MTVAVPLRRRGRPPKDQAGTSQTRAALVRAGVAALTEKGFAATGLDEVLTAAAVPKGSFYHYFDSKEAFGAALIDAYAAYFATKLDRHFREETVPPLDRFCRFIDDARAGMARHDFRRGCLIGNLGQEMAALPEAYRQRLLDVFADWQARTAACLRAARDDGQIPPTADCDALAEFFWTGWEGAVLRAKLERRVEPLDRFAQHFFRLLGC
ncbi:MAG: TetR/AcrR family transcriptional regulator [Azospirillaceae bacterium]|nr:TetR/AcrR family transcriptional regulator [Azospirillaceae bacterium]